ncbi:MAG TPA: VWA domain-containing protein [Symbiobacteriaceae bacterium]|nr:VWA domain-containing protein [Symbiobacteriaceae bacterium]
MASDEAKAALLRWRMVLGAPPAGSPPGLFGEADALVESDPELQGMDRALNFLYGGDRSAGLGGSMPYLPQWLGDIRRYFPTPVVSFLQKDAIEQRGLKQLLLEPETLQTLEKDVNLAATILHFKDLMPEETKRTARVVIGEIVEQLKKRLEQQTRQAVMGALTRDRHSPMRVARNLDFKKTIREGLKHYQPSLGRVIPERVYFWANQRRFHEWRVIVLVDQSGSMGESVVYSSLIAAVFASLPALDTRLIFFDTAVADVSDQLSDPVEVLFGVRLGGGTDIARAVAYASSLIAQPEKTLFLLITDLYEGGDRRALLRHLAQMQESRVKTLCVLALNDAGTASYDKELARQVANLGIPAFAATPNRLVEAVEKALKGGVVDGV